MKAIFLDKDGTLLENLPFEVDPARMILGKGAGPGMRLLARLGYRLFVLSNQSGIAHGRFGMDAIDGVRQRLGELLRSQHVNLAGFYFCPHHPAGSVHEYALDCLCRKPMPGMVLQAAAIHGIDLPRSWMVGAILDDIEAGKRAGCRTILLDNGNETEWEFSPRRVPDYLAPNLYAAAVLIANDDEARAKGLPPDSLS